MATLTLNLAKVLSRAIYMQGKYKLNPHRYLLHFEVVQTILPLESYFAHPSTLIIHVHATDHSPSSMVIIQLFTPCKIKNQRNELQSSSFVVSFLKKGKMKRAKIKESFDGHVPSPTLAHDQRMWMA